MNREDEAIRPSDPDDKPDVEDEALPPNPDGPHGVIAGAALGGPPAVAIGEAIEGDWPDTEPDEAPAD
jgi:hypothetical protein